MSTAVLALPLVLLLPHAQDPETMSVHWKDNRTGNVQVMGVEGDKVRLKMFIMGGSTVITSPLADFTPESAFAIELAAAQPATFDAHFALAKKAGELHLVPQAGKQARAAVASLKDDPQAKAKESEVRAWAAGALERVLAEAVAAQNLPAAKHYLKLITTRLADQRSEQQLDALAASVNALEGKQAATKQAERQAKLDAKAKAEVERRLKPIQDKITAADKLLHEAFVKSGNTSAAARSCEKAVESYKASWKATQSLAEQYPDDADLQNEVVAIGEHLHDHAIRAALQAANSLTIQGDYRNAMDWANRILAFEPTNAEAKEMVRTIQLASASASGDWAWGWRTTDR